jgi:predicted glycoside hydrolase/deacetylase ChbG (UPF0249 family)
VRSLIVNADDFGRSAGINRGVALTHEQGIVTSASLMVCRPTAQEAARYAHAHPDLSVGLHLDLGEWVYAEGEWRQVLESPADACGEIGRQLDIFMRLMGRPPTHLDSHQHVHRDDPVATCSRVLAAELGVPLRGCDEHVDYCGAFYGQTATGEPLHHAITVAALEKLLASLRDGLTEIACHPGVGTEDDLPYGTERSMEVKTLCDPRIRAALQANRIALRSYNAAI